MTKEELKIHWPFIVGELRNIEGRGVCGINISLFTFGLVVGLDEHSFYGRWCYETLQEAEIALKHWDGVGDPPGLWVKYKGVDAEYGNAYRDDFSHRFGTVSPHYKKSKNGK